MIENRDKIQIREISYNTPDYTKELVLRDKVLRKPLGMSLYDANLDAEKDDVHIGAFVNNDMVGVLILTRLNADEVKMRQVAVDEDWRSLNIGRALVVFAEESSKMKGFKTMLLNARKAAVGFYDKLGYEIISDEFLEINIPHYKMCKQLSK